MDLLKLPDDIIKYVESYVDKRPVFADELMNYDFKLYTYETMRYNHYGICTLHRIFDIDPWFSNFIDDDTSSTWISRLYVIRACCCLKDFQLEESLFGNHYDYCRGTNNKYHNNFLHRYHRPNTMGLIMEKDSDPNIPAPQTFRCGT